MKILIPSFFILALVGCEYKPNMKPSKPFGMSKIKNHSRHYEPSGETPKHLENFMSDDRAESEVAMEQALKAVAPEKLSSVRKAYGIPSAEGVKTDDREALLQLYRIEASRLKELLK